MSNRQLFSGKSLRCLLLVFLFLLMAPVLAEAAKVTYLVKPAQVKKKGSDRWISLNMGDEVREGDSVRTGMGARVELTITIKRQFRIGQATEIEVRGLDEKSRGLKADIQLILGRFWGSLRKPLRKYNQEQFQVQTTTATIGVKGTTFGVDFDKESKTAQVAVVNGKVAVNPPKTEVGPPKEISGPREIAPPQEISEAEWMRLVSRDQKLVIRPGVEPTLEPLTEEDKKDEWIAFNIARDRQE